MTDRLRPEFEALARALTEPLVDPSEPEERVWFCPQCGLTGPEMPVIDEDGCCAVCGATCCRRSELVAHLAKAGLHLVSEADKRVLDAIRDLKIVRCVGQLVFSDSRENELCEAEVAARAVR